VQATAGIETVTPSNSEKILMSLNSEQKPLCQLATAELFPNETWKQQKNHKRAFGLDALD